MKYGEIKKVIKNAMEENFDMIYLYTQLQDDLIL